MRIISGKFKGRKIYNPTDNITRPLKDRVRESIFNIIEHSKEMNFDLINSNVLDLYSGVGSFGLECLSRGAKQVYFFEKYIPALKILKKNIKTLGYEDGCEIIESDVEKIEDTYLPALDKIEKNIKDAIEFAETSIKGAKTEQSKKILKSNIKSNEFTMKVLGQYRNILINQMKSLQNALDRTKEQITVAYSTYDTAANSANLVNLINQTQDSFNKIMNMQLPNIVPFENKELEIKFLEISDQLVQSTES